MKLGFTLLLGFVISTLFCQLNFSIELNKVEYELDEDIILSFKLHNSTDSLITVTCPNTAPFAYFIDDINYVVGSYQTLTNFTLEPDSTYSLVFSHTESLPVGEHIIEGRFFTMDETFDAEHSHFYINSVNVIDNQINSYNLRNFPNPFNPTTNIQFSVSKTCDAEVLVFNLKGQKIKTLFKESVEKGDYSLQWNGSNSDGNIGSSGIYYYQLLIDNEIVKTRKCILLK